MGKVVRLNRPMTKMELVRHLEKEHSDAIRVKIEPHRWSKVELVDTHRLIHLGLGR